MKRTALIFLVFTFACQSPAEQVSSVPSKGSAALKHYEIRADRLPPPRATGSSSNPGFVIGRPRNATLVVPPGFAIREWATGGFEQPRAMALAPNGDVFVADGDAGCVVVLRDADRNGNAETRFVFASGLDRPYGLVFIGGWLYVGNTGAVVRFAYKPGQTRATAPPQEIAKLPPGGHWTRALALSADGKKLYVGVGSASNVSAGEPQARAAITEMDLDGTGRRIFASGLRNPAGLAIDPSTGALWTVVNERDGLGDDLPPDYATSVRDGGFYGWPYAYIGRHEDPSHRGRRPDLVQRTIVPDLLLQAHSAPLGIAFYVGAMFPPDYRGSAFIALHGSWNRSARTGYKVVRARFVNGKPAGGYDDFVIGWAPDPDALRVWGRPVGLLVLPDGSLLISDDGGNRIWRVTYEGTVKK